VLRGEPKVIFLNQMAGPLFRELAEDLARDWPGCVLYTGHPDTVGREGTAELEIRAAPGYDRSSNRARLLSWFRYFFAAFRVVWQGPPHALLFLVSNPPFLGLLGLLFRLLRGQQYMVLVYDIYPDLLTGLGRLKPGPVTRAWDALNRLVYERAALVVTIGEDMRRRLERKFDVSKTAAGTITCVPCWADLEFLKPLSKEANPFAREHGLVGKTVVLYSGNMGNTHDIETPLQVARELAGEAGIQFLFIGEGAKRPLVAAAVAKEGLTNVTLLPFQPETMLPYSLPAGDIGIVGYERGTEGCMVPSKTYYYLAAGLAPLVSCEGETEVSELVATEACGVRVRSRDRAAMKAAILALHRDPALLAWHKTAARTAAESHYSRRNTVKFAAAVAPFVAAEEATRAERHWFYARCGKRLFDLALTVPGVLTISPLLLALALLVRLKMGSPVLFTQVRPGLGGQPFRMLKFRTMTDERGADGALLPDAERLTRLGRFLRTASLDELPAVLNVLKGEMSLVGPRPLLMRYLDRYTPQQARRHEVKPGITGWAQVKGRNALTWEQKFALDVWYVGHRSLWLDVKILALTFWKVFRREGVSQAGHATMPEFMGSEEG